MEHRPHNQESLRIETLEQLILMSASTVDGDVDSLAELELQFPRESVESFGGDSEAVDPFAEFVNREGFDARPFESGVVDDAVFAANTNGAVSGEFGPDEVELDGFETNEFEEVPREAGFGGDADVSPPELDPEFPEVVFDDPRIAQSEVVGEETGNNADETTDSGDEIAKEQIDLAADAADDFGDVVSDLVIPTEFRVIAESSVVGTDAGGDAAGNAVTSSENEGEVVIAVDETTTDDADFNPPDGPQEGSGKFLAASNGGNPTAETTATTTSGTDQSEWIAGFEGNNIINAQGGNDEIYVPFGNSVVDGGAGDDALIVYEGNSTEYNITYRSGGVVVVEGPGLNEATVRYELTNVERIVFNDRVVFLSDQGANVVPLTNGTDGDDWIAVSERGGDVDAGAGDDSIYAPLSESFNEIDGGSGSDTLIVYGGVRADYTLQRSSNANGNQILVEGPGLNGTQVINLLTDVEFILFDDGLVKASEITEELTRSFGRGSDV